MIACDTSVLIAAFARWHDSHHIAAAALSRVDAVVDHVAVETYSVLTRMPAPRRAPPHLVTKFLDRHLPPSTTRLPGAPAREVLAAAQRSGVVGGAVYDLVVALSAVQAGAVLLSLDRRAAGTYEAAGTAFELLS